MLLRVEYRKNESVPGEWHEIEIHGESLIDIPGSYMGPREKVVSLFRELVSGEDPKILESQGKRTYLVTVNPHTWITEK